MRARSGERNGLKITRNPLVGAGYLPKQAGKSEPRNRTYIMTTIIQAPYMMIRERKKGEPEPEGNDRYEGYCKDFADMISREKGISFEIRSVGRYLRIYILR